MSRSALVLPGDSDRFGLIKASMRRLRQAAQTLRNQSTKEGVLIVLDASDNAQIEADNRKEDAFPRLLLSALSNEPIDGIKLLLTARPHRMAGVVANSSVEPYELGPFTDDEVREFLESRRAKVSSVELSTCIARSRGT